jgi:hypothetical protein
MVGLRAMTYVVDSGGVTALAMERETMVTHINRGQWPPEVPAIVLADCLTGDHRRDHAANRVLGLCMVRDVPESVSGRAAALRTRTARAASVSAVVAVVVAMAEGVEHCPVVTGDPGDISALAAHSDRPIRVLPV